MPYRRPKHLFGFLAGIVIFSLTRMTINVRHDKDNLFFESIVVWFFSPAQSLFTNTIDSISDVLGHYLFLVRASKENERLHLEIDRLAKEKNELLEKSKHLKRLEKLVGYFDKKERPVITAEVTGRDATQWSKMIFINKGTDHKIEKNLAVMTDAGIVGHVIHSSAKSSKVLLITDSRSAIDSLFQETRGSGVTVGIGEDVCEMKFVPIVAEVKLGDKVISSGLGGVFPKGLLVGTVADVVKEKQDLFQRITIAPSANLSRLEEVAIVLPDKEGA